ncbi:MAG: hypothetical protein JSW25_05685 [Thermoplasmata archaeon]|nr:MAG: hypothetical protein JSW25_05685 [Thermoplasmata archaeon]
MGRGNEYECPDCGASFGFGKEECPSCGVEIDWDGTESVEIGEEPVRLVDPRLPEVREEVVPPEPIFSRWGLIFVLLTVLAFSGTVLLMRWDTWVRGEEVDSIGDSQRTLIYAGTFATTAFAILAILDIMRGQTTLAGVPSE